MAIYYPPAFINRYLQENIALLELGAVPMYPTVPTDPDIADGFTITELTGNDPTARFSFQGTMAIYDRMFKMRRQPFPHIKSEQVLYYFYAVRENAVPNLIEITQKIQDLLDGGDESAQDINTWIDNLPDGTTANTKLISGTEFNMPYFHEIKIYQLEETRDIIDFGTARTFAGNKIIIDYDWHKS